MKLRTLLTTLTLLLLAFTALTVSAQDDVNTEAYNESVDPYLMESFNPDYLAEDVTVYDDAYQVTYTGVDEVTDESLLYQPDLAEVETTITNWRVVGDDQVVADFDLITPAIADPVPVRGVFDIDNDGLIERVTYYYDNTPFIEAYDYDFAPDAVNYYGNPQEMVENIEDNPDEYYGETVTISGSVETILDKRSFVVQDSEPFDLTPLEIVVVGETADMFTADNLNINEGQRVQVTGTLRGVEFADLSTELGWDLDDTLLSRFSDDTDEVAIVASNVQIMDDTLINDTDAAVEAALNADTFGLNRETAELAENNPELFYGETVTIRGVIENITEDGLGMRVQNHEPFDFTPPTFFVVDTTGDGFGNAFIEEGAEVNVTGTLQPFEAQDFNLAGWEGELGWDIDDSFLSAWVEDTDEFLMLSDDSQVQLLETD